MNRKDLFYYYVGDFIVLARRAPRGVQPGKANGEGLLLEAQDHGVTTVRVRQSHEQSAA